MYVIEPGMNFKRQ